MKIKKEEIIKSLNEVYANAGEANLATSSEQRPYDSSDTSTKDIKVFFASGRVNLIGEHIDYNGGSVLPCALSQGTYLAARKREDKTLRLFSRNFCEDGILAFSLETYTTPKNLWSDYVAAVIRTFEKNGFLIKQGLDVYCQGDLPNRAGLSSSASLEMVVGLMLRSLYNFALDDKTLVMFAQQAENEFIDVQCGVMDQFAVGFGRAEKATLLNTQNLQYSYADLNLRSQGLALVICNSNKQRGLASSAYNQRRSQCQQALEILRRDCKISYLCDLTVEDFEKHKHLLTDSEIQKRARHTVYENRRVHQAYASLQNNDMQTFGKLMNASHKSLKEDFEVTGLELDVLVENTQTCKGVLGSRMTGAGFGGCTVTLIKNDSIDEFQETLTKVYRQKVGYEPHFYKVEIGNGLREL